MINISLVLSALGVIKQEENIDSDGAEPDEDGLSLSSIPDEPLDPKKSVAVAHPSSTPTRSKRSRAPAASKDKNEWDLSGDDEEEEELESAGASKKKKQASPAKSTKKSPAKKGKNARGRK